VAEQPGIARHVVVVGLMGAGKSEVGRRLAARLDRHWRDSDRDIEARTGMTVRQLGDRDGVEAMHELEARHLLEALADPEPTVISAAASTVEIPECRERLRGPSVTAIWLRATPATLAQRFGSRDKHRPEFGDSPHAFLTEQAARRDPLFASLDPIVIDVDRVRPRDVVERALEALR
jgi:shikimate kinase